MFTRSFTALENRLSRELRDGTPGISDVILYSTTLHRTASVPMDSTFSSLLPRLILKFPVDAFSEQQRRVLANIFYRIIEFSPSDLATDVYHAIAPCEYQDLEDSWVIPKVCFPAGYNQPTNSLTYLVRDIRLFKALSPEISSDGILTEHARLGRNDFVFPSMPLIYAIESHVIRDRDTHQIARDINSHLSSVCRHLTGSSSRVHHAYSGGARPDMVFHNAGRPDGSALGGSWSIPGFIDGWLPGIAFVQMPDDGLTRGLVAGDDVEARSISRCLLGESDIESINLTSMGIVGYPTRISRYHGGGMSASSVLHGANADTFFEIFASEGSCVPHQALHVQAYERR